MLNFKQFFQEYAGPGTEFDQLGIQRNQMSAVVGGEIFMIGDEQSGQMKINGKIFSTPIPARIDIHDANFQVDEKGNFISGTLVVMPKFMPTQTGKVGRVMGGKMYQNPVDVDEIRVHINAKQLKDVMTVGLQQAANNPMGAMGGGMPGMGGGLGL